VLSSVQSASTNPKRLFKGVHSYYLMILIIICAQSASETDAGKRKRELGLEDVKGSPERGGKPPSGYLMVFIYISR